MRDDDRVTRIVAGVAGGRRLAVPPRGTRPTSERVREALFSAIESAIELDGARVLDLYAGSGALGLEALSRGAADVTFVEHDQSAIAVLRKNIASVGLPGAHVRRGRVGTVLAEAATAPYDLVLADPPYAAEENEVRAMLAGIAGRTRPGSVVVVERSTRSGPPEWPEPLRPGKVRRYGDTELHWAQHVVPEG
jgi:16S rRNA (guanine966-N2)-methyltransferase